MYRIVYTKQAVKDIKNLKSAGLDKKAKKLIDIMRENPFQNPPPYEKLIGNLKGYCSRRINIQHRIVYQVINDPNIHENVTYNGYVKIIRMWTHINVNIKMYIFDHLRMYIFAILPLDRYIFLSDKIFL